MLGTSAEQDDEKQVQLLSLELALQRRSYRRPSTLTPVSASRVARSRCSDFYQAGAAIGLMRPRWDWRHFSAAKKSTKNHCTQANSSHFKNH